MVDIVSRQTWGALPPKQSLPQLAYPVKDVFLHHEGGDIIDVTGTSWTPAQEMEHMRQLQADCMGKGYSDFPYGIAVFPSGRAYEGRDLGFVCGGQTAEEAATLNNNGTSVAIVWPGNYDEQHPTTAQLDATADVIGIAQLAGVVDPNPNVRGHRDVFATACPGESAYESLPAIRGLESAPPPDSPEVQALKAIALLVTAIEAKPCKLGDEDEKVKLIQALLLRHGFDERSVLHPLAGVPQTGKYDNATCNAVHRFKVAHSIGLPVAPGQVCGRDCIQALLKPAAKAAS